MAAMNMNQTGYDQFYSRIINTFNLPTTNRCAELTVLLDRCTILELQNAFPYLIESIFGPQSSQSWGLRTTPETMGEEFKQIRHFLSPCGPLFRCIYTLLRETTIKYEFPLSYLPNKVKQVLESDINHPFYSDLVQINQQTKQLISLSMNPFDYYMFHFAYYLINPWHQRSANIDYSWNTVYYILCCDYIIHFLPTDPNIEILPNISNYNGKNPAQATPQINRSYYVSSLLSPKILNKSAEDYSFHQTFDKHPRNEIWRSETVLTVFIDLWLSNDQTVQNLNSFNNPQAMPLLQYNELPSGEYMRILRVFIKQIHAFSASSKADDTHLSELKKIALPMIQAKFYIFIRNLVHKWPLDGSFRLVLELWLTYIQPWRYPPNNLTKHLNPVKNEEDVVLTQTSFVERDWLPFIVDNLLAYVVIFQQLLPRFLRVDLGSPKMAMMLCRIAKVFNQPNLASLLREVERCVENNHSPSHGYNFQSVLPPLSPTTMWSTNTLKKSNIECNTKLFAPDSTNYFDKKWICVLRQKIYELEGPNFCYKPLFTKPPAHEVFSVLDHIKRSMFVAQDIIATKEEENARTYSGIRGFLRSLFDTNVANDEFTLAERKKVPCYLEFSMQSLIEIFEIDGDFEREFESNTSNNSQDDRKFLTPSKVKQRIKRIKYEGDPDLLPIMTYENTFLVRVLYQLATGINEKFGPLFSRLYSDTSFKGRLARQLLCEPITIFNYDKSKENSPRVSRRLPPRVSFRQLGNYKFLIYFVFGAFLFKLFGFGVLLYVLFLTFIFLSYKIVKAIPRRHIYPTEGFCNIIFNDSF